jgi:hypothetical protein
MSLKTQSGAAIMPDLFPTKTYPKSLIFTRYVTFNISFFDLVTNSAVKKFQIPYCDVFDRGHPI